MRMILSNETFCKLIKNLTCNTVVHFKWIESNSSEYQPLLEHIAYYFTQTKVLWQEIDVGVEFFDVENAKTKQIHHFRSWGFKRRYSMLMTVGVNVCWINIY